MTGSWQPQFTTGPPSNPPRYCDCSPMRGSHEQSIAMAGPPAASCATCALVRDLTDVQAPHRGVAFSATGIASIKIRCLDLWGSAMANGDAE